MHGIGVGIQFGLESSRKQGGVGIFWGQFGSEWCKMKRGRRVWGDFRVGECEIGRGRRVGKDVEVGMLNDEVGSKCEVVVGRDV